LIGNFGQKSINRTPIWRTSRFGLNYVAISTGAVLPQVVTSSPRPDFKQHDISADETTQRAECRQRFAVDDAVLILARKKAQPVQRHSPLRWLFCIQPPPKPLGLVWAPNLKLWEIYMTTHTQDPKIP
ncbi:hypothetical protein T265_15878, partial [Opisthorchis viverrini]